MKIKQLLLIPVLLLITLVGCSSGVLQDLNNDFNAQNVLELENTNLTPDMRVFSIAENVPFERNSLENIQIGNFGLLSFVVTNNTTTETSFKRFGIHITMERNIPVLDQSYSTCNLNGQQLLKGESCILTIRFTPHYGKQTGSFQPYIAWNKRWEVYGPRVKYSTK